MSLISHQVQLSLYKKMLKIRLVEERIAELYSTQEMRCPVHLSIGQEATATGMCEVLKNEDLVFGNHRSHGHYLAKGGCLRKMLAEIYGKETGCSRGIGGSMHLIDLDVGFVASTPIVGGTIPVAVGAALANHLKRNGIITTVFLGDGTAEEGIFHESLNFSSLKKLPLIFFCENNFYSVYTPLQERQPANRHIADIVRAHGIFTEIVDGNNVLDVYRAAQDAYKKVVSGNGPVYIEATTYRWREHCGPNYDNDLGYRPEKEFQSWKKKCPIEHMTHQLLETGDTTPDFIEKLRCEIYAEIEDAICFAQKSPFADTKHLLKHVYAE